MHYELQTYLNTWGFSSYFFRDVMLFCRTKYNKFRSLKNQYHPILRYVLAFETTFIVAVSGDLNACMCIFIHIILQQYYTSYVREKDDPTRYLFIACACNLPPPNGIPREITILLSGLYQSINSIQCHTFTVLITLKVINSYKKPRFI